MEQAVEQRRTLPARVAWLAGPSAGALFTITVVGFAAIRNDGYSHGTKAVSELGVVGAPAAGLFNLLGFIAPGLLIAWFSWSLLRVAQRRIGPLLLLGSGLLFAVAGIFPAELDKPEAVTSLGHVIGAIGSGLLWAAALFWMGPLLSRQFGLTSWGRVTPWFLLFLVVHSGWQVTFQATGQVLPGWGQRIGFLGYLLWFGVTGWLLWRHRDRNAQPRPSSRLQKWIKRVVLAVAVLLLLGAGWVTYMMNRPRECAVEAPGATGVRVTEAGLFANYFPAVSGRPGAAVLVIGGSEGGLSREAKRQAMALQAAGFSALQLAYHCAPGKPTGIVRVPLEEFTRALDWLGRRPEVDPAALGIVGYSKGAEAALLVAARRADVRAVAAGMPSSVAWDAIGPLSLALPGMRSSWTERGRDVPGLPYGSLSHQRGEAYGLHANGLRELARHRPALIPVDRIRAPTLLVCGDLDRIWPACEMAEQIIEQSAGAGRSTPVLLRYPQGGHGVFGPAYPANDKGARQWASMGGTPDSNSAARRDSWPRVVAFLSRALAPQARAQGENRRERSETRDAG